MTQTYWLNGLKVDSDFDLPALARWDGPEAVAADIAIRRGEVPARLDAPDHVAPIFQTRGDSEYLLALPGTGRILVRNGSEVTVEPETGSDALATSAILTGPIQAVLWHQRGLLPLHASVVVVGGRAIALCGPSAVGKSTLAAMLAERGCAVIADDMCLVDAREGGGVAVLPGCSRQRLWRDALEYLGAATSDLKRALADKEKYFLDCPAAETQERFAVGALVSLSRRNIGVVELERIRGAQAVDTLYGLVHTRRPAGALGRGRQIFAALTRLASSGPTIWRLTIPEGPAFLREAAVKVLTVLEG